MSRPTAIAVAVFVAAGWLCGNGRAAHAGAAGDPVPESKGAGDVARCPACSFQCPKGTVNCWACGTHVPGAKTAKDLAPVKPVKMTFPKADKTRAEDMAGVPPLTRFRAIESWTAENPSEFDEGISRLTELLQDVLGTALEVTITTRVELIKRAKAEANRPKTPEEREAAAARAVLPVILKVRSSKNVRSNVKKLKALFEIARGTSFEGLVKRQLDSELDKQR